MDSDWAPAWDQECALGGKSMCPCGAGWAQWSNGFLRRLCGRGQICEANMGNLWAQWIVPLLMARNQDSRIRSQWSEMGNGEWGMGNGEWGMGGRGSSFVIGVFYGRAGLVRENTEREFGRVLREIAVFAPKLGHFVARAARAVAEKLGASRDCG